jgi:hypothetical protein
MITDYLTRSDLHQSAPIELNEWINAWPSVRGEIEALAQQYADSKPECSQDMIAWLLEETDSVLRLLSYRVDWLKQQTKG